MVNARQPIKFGKFKVLWYSDNFSVEYRVLVSSSTSASTESFEYEYSKIAPQVVLEYEYCTRAHLFF